MEVPGKILYILAYCKTEQPVISTKLGHMRAPSTAKLDVDVFDGGRACLLDYILYEEACDNEATIVAFMGKEGVTSTVEGRGASTVGNVKSPGSLNPTRKPESTPCEVESATCTQTGLEATPTLWRYPTFSSRLSKMIRPI